uniref:TPR_REGION domain-containing protein n=1 Tax=Onchocerca flexuosa TaxID=387005 RepID=A0A183HXH9_9BILA
LILIKFKKKNFSVAIQCLETAFNITDSSYLFQPSKPLFDIFIAAEGLPAGIDDFPKPTTEEIQQANNLKEEGNTLMKSSQFEDAILKYNEAIKLNKDPAYFCNR